MSVFTVAQHQIIQQYLLTKDTHSRLPEPPLWALINKHFPPPNSDFQFWWRTTGIALAVLLQKAGYSVDAQCQHLLFYYYNIVPELGVGPDAQGLPRYWKSFMTDHFAPIELSWEWGCGGDVPTVRFSIEPIGPYAGTPIDPLNHHATARLVHQYQPLIQECDLRLFDHFSTKLLSYTNLPAETGRSRACQGHSSRTFVAFEFGKDALMLKAYFLPTFKAAELGQSTWDIIRRAIEDLPDSSLPAFSGLSTLQNFMMSSPQGLELEAEIFAVDCVGPTRSRLKIYMRSRSTCFDSVREIMTLGGVLDGSGLRHGLDELQKLWKLVLSQEQEFSTAADLRQKDHRTAGILYYFDIKQGRALPGVKVYIPVRHYGQNDLAIAKGLSIYLKSRGQGSLACKYLEALESISPSSSLRSRLGIQTYLGCSIVGGQLKLTSYLAPEVYRRQLH
ncbi:hypothetical protein MMC30_007835 [Trapelia coarctata]|nr:hypothetical protein [Trapelia coarctata]